MSARALTARASTLLICAAASLSAGGESAGEAGSDASILLPPGFGLTVFHDGVGAGARHLVVRDNGDVLVAMRGGELVALRDADHDGRAERSERRDLPITTGMALRDGSLYFSDRVSVSRLALDDGLLPGGEPQTVVSDFPAQQQHADKALAFDAAGRLYVNVGAPSNACQQKDRVAGSKGQRPCPLLERQAGIWRFPAGKLGLRQQDGERYLTGTRNVVALDWNNAADALYFAMHGRDQLDTLWPDLFDVEDNARMPAEELHRGEAGADYGWPFTFVDPDSGRRLLAPEYGGDGEQQAEAGRYRQPLASFPAHWAPNDLVFYDGAAFPAAYRGGAFIAWHGSWNRAPLPQQGFRVSFVPFAEGAPAGQPEDFMTGFSGAGPVAQPGEARHRPTGLAIGPDGALYVADSIEGRIWRVSADLSPSAREGGGKS